VAVAVAVAMAVVDGRRWLRGQGGLGRWRHQVVSVARRVVRRGRPHGVIRGAGQRPRVPRARRRAGALLGGRGHRHEAHRRGTGDGNSR
jgi:hypothetical protein